jgi:probable rRNA maturation factor
MKISFYNQQKALKIPKNKFSKIIKFLLENEKVETEALGVYFVGKKRSSEVHKEFFNDPSPTDCMSFPVDDFSNPIHGHHYLGDVMICPEVALDNHENYGHSLEEETALYLIHAILHLVGYDDKKKNKRMVMRKKERIYLKIYKELKDKS